MGLRQRPQRRAASPPTSSWGRGGSRQLPSCPRSMAALNRLASAQGLPIAGPRWQPPCATMSATTCPACGLAFQRSGRQRFCSSGCRQAVWRAARRAPAEPLVARSGTVYECPQCDARYLGEQRCGDCNTWCRRLGPGAPCPHCDEPVAMSDLFSDDQLAKNSTPTRRKS